MIMRGRGLLLAGVLGVWIAGVGLMAEAAEVPVNPRLTTPLGSDAFIVTGFQGEEGVSQPFRFSVELASARNIDPVDLVGQEATLQWDLPPGGQRFVNGVIAQFSAEGPIARSRLFRYRAELVPAIALLQHTKDFAIFQNTTATDTVRLIVLKHDTAHVVDQTTLAQAPREYTVQYNETDFAFISRLLEQAGIQYFFTHQDGAHSMVLADPGTPVSAIPGYERLRFDPSLLPISSGERLTSWRHQAAYKPGKFAQTDYNFESPSTNLLTSALAAFSTADPDQFEIFEYPGGYGTVPDGQALAGIRMQEQEADFETIIGDSSHRGLKPGHKFFAIVDRTASAHSGDYYVVKVVHRFSTSGLSLTSAPLGSVYENQFAAIPAAVPFRPKRITLKPVVAGPQTAFVVGPAGAEIHTDTYGRIKVKFHWDRAGQSDENSSCWIRVAHPWTGSQVIPRIGWEVIVEFQDGDPDRPLVTGRVFNGEDATQQEE